MQNPRKIVIQVANILGFILLLRTTLVGDELYTVQSILADRCIEWRNFALNGEISYRLPNSMTRAQKREIQDVSKPGISRDRNRRATSGREASTLRTSLVEKSSVHSIPAASRKKITEFYTNFFAEVYDPENVCTWRLSFLYALCRNLIKLK